MTIIIFETDTYPEVVNILSASQITSLPMRPIFQHPFSYAIYLFLLCATGIFSCKEHSQHNASSADTVITKTIVHTPVIVELIGKPGTSLKDDSLFSIAQENHIPAPEVYQWKNHLVLVGNISDVDNIQRDVRAAYSNAEVKVYEHPFYNFNRYTHCNATVAKEWKNIVLTANLVADTSLQQEYLNDHATQFEKWPEVSKGFCNANFQQLLVYKNGRQLMLVISIPEGKNLDELNPKTTENNPRVNEWNERMKKYQEGIEGTKKGETWVFLKQAAVRN
jgi:hypothetical protein